MGKPDAPAPPDPIETARAQTGTNVSTAIANNAMSNVNQVTPYGNLTYEQIGEYTWTDPTTGDTYSAPRTQATTTLNPMQQHTLSQTQLAQGHLANTAVDQAQFLESYLGNTDAFTDQIDEKLYDLGSKRLEPRFERQEADLRTRLANQGIAPGSEAYNREIELMTEGKNDAYNQLLLTGRGAAMDEVNAPLNRIIGLLSGSQVQSPNVQIAQQSRMPTTDVAGLINQNYNQQLGAWQTDVANRQNLMGGLFGLGSAGIMAA